RVEELVEDRVHAVLRLVAVHTELFDDDALLHLDVARPQHRRADEVGDDVESDLPVTRVNARPEDRDLVVGGRVHDAARALDALADLGGRRTLRRPLDDDVLEEMASAGVRARLETRSSADEPGDRRG